MPLSAGQGPKQRGAGDGHAGPPQVCAYMRICKYVRICTYVYAHTSTKTPTHTCMQVQAALEKAMQGRTVLVIAPRLSTVSRIYAYLHLHARPCTRP